MGFENSNGLVYWKSHKTGLYYEIKHSAEKFTNPINYIDAVCSDAAFVEFIKARKDPRLDLAEFESIAFSLFSDFNFNRFRPVSIERILQPNSQPSYLEVYWHKIQKSEFKKLSIKTESIYDAETDSFKDAYKYFSNNEEYLFIPYFEISKHENVSLVTDGVNLFRIKK